MSAAADNVCQKYSMHRNAMKIRVRTSEGFKGWRLLVGARGTPKSKKPSLGAALPRKELRTTGGELKRNVLVSDLGACHLFMMRSALIHSR